MKDFLETIAFIIGGLAFFTALAYLSEVARSWATPSKKVCDICFRDIERWHNAVDIYKQKEGKDI